MDKFNCRWLDKNGSFFMRRPQHSTGMYFPLAGESGMKSAVTASLAGDAKCDQDTFLLPPVSIGDLHTSKMTRNFWLRFSVGAWSATGVSAEEETLRGTPLEEQVSVEAGFMWYVLHRFSPKYKLEAEITAFVPYGEDPVELLRIVIRNCSTEPVTITPISAIPLYCRSADNIRDHRHVTSLLHRASIIHNGMTVSPTLAFNERGHRENTKVYYALGAEDTGVEITAVCPSLADFIGEGGSLTRPAAVYDSAFSWPGPDHACDGEELIAALRFSTATLQPGAQRCFTLCLGVAEKGRANEAIERVKNTLLCPGGAEAAFEFVKNYWAEKANVHICTGDENYDQFMRWVSFQPILRRIYGCSFLPYHDYGKGGRGWRDLWQDCMALIIMEPDNVRHMLVNGYCGVRFDGTNATIIGQNEGEFLADRNGISRVWMDHGFWPLLTTDYYIQFTGDTSILLERIPYFKDAHVCRSEQVDTTWEESLGTMQRDRTGNVVYGSVLEHILLENLTACLDVGMHGIIRLRGADWNDGLDMASERGESVAFTFAYAWNLRKIVALLHNLPGGQTVIPLQREIASLLRQSMRTPDEKRAALYAFNESCTATVSGEAEQIPLQFICERLNELAGNLEDLLRRQEWLITSEGSFFNGYYDQSGRQLDGERENGVGMNLTGQVFPIMSGIANSQQIESIVAAADKLLYQEDIGGYRLNTDYGTCKMGRAFGFAYGHKENGAVFSHMTVMFANALYSRGYTKEGHKALTALYRQASNFEKCRQYPGLPEYFDGKGRGMYPYLTGSASWMLLTVLTEIFGVKGSLGDIILSPQIMAEQLDEHGCAALQFSLNGTPLRICYYASQQKQIYTAVDSLTLDGIPIPGNRICKAQLGGYQMRSITARLV